MTLGNRRENGVRADDPLIWVRAVHFTATIFQVLVGEQRATNVGPGQRYDVSGKRASAGNG
jgi:hypothetical protein